MIDEEITLSVPNFEGWRVSFDREPTIVNHYITINHFVLHMVLITILSHYHR